MKLTDFALVFIGVALPIIIVVYVNVSYTIKASEQEMYYETIINSAIQDGINQMKEVENSDKSIDYGYSGLWNNKVSVNSKLAVDTFLNSLYNNFGIKGNKSTEHYLKLFIPAIAVIDYNGVQISSMEEYVPDSSKPTEKLVEHTLKPKRYYSYSFAVVKKTDTEYEVVDLENAPSNVVAKHTIDFTMDDYVVHRGENINPKGFYLSDEKNNSPLFEGMSTLTPKSEKDKIVKLLKGKRKEVIANIVMNEVAYAINKNNSYARVAGIKYDFVFPNYTKEDWYKTVENIGMIAFVQGLSVGNKYLDYHAYGIADLTQIKRYYLTIPSVNSKYKYNLYHSNENCPEYRVSTKLVSPSYAISKQQAASMSASMSEQTGEGEQHTGFYPCPICKP